MRTRMKTEILNIGDELLIGQVVNTNASWMAKELDIAGFPVHRITMIPDDREVILNSLSEAETRSDIVIITGGLGPTKDDMTKEVLCTFFDSKLVFHEPSFKNIERIFLPRGFKVTDLNRKQAEIPDVATPLHNELGTAPGMWFEKTNQDRLTVFVSLPGVPFEMKSLITDEVIPRLQKKFPSLPLVHKTLMTQGIGESFLSDILEEWETGLPSFLHLAYLPQPGIVRLRLTGSGPDIALLKKAIEEATAKLYQVIPDYIFGEDEETLEEIVGKLLKARKLTLSTAESATGGYIAHLITRIPGSSEYYKGSIVAYANEIKESQLGVKTESLTRYGAVSEQVVTEMALGVRKKFGTDYSIATSGIAGPGGGTAGKPVGTTWIALATPEGVNACHYLMGEGRERNIRKTSLEALNLLRKAIIRK
jgi:nicotinamide-nucleotide amidase